MFLDLSTGKAVVSDIQPDFEVLVAGDFCPQGQSGKAILSGKSCDILSEVMSELKHKDLSLINLVTPLINEGTPVAKSSPNLRVAPGCEDMLPAGNFDVAIFANNHTADFGPEGVINTLDSLSEKDHRFCRGWKGSGVRPGTAFYHPKLE